MEQNNNKITTILIIEDDSFISEMYAYIFKKQGYQVIEAQNGKEGIKLAQKEPIDLILLDIMMPKMNGIEVIKRLKNPSSPTVNIPILLLTNLGQESVIREAYRLGADGYLLKADLVPRQIVEKVEAFLSGKITKEDFLPAKSME